MGNEEMPTNIEAFDEVDEDDDDDEEYADKELLLQKKPLKKPRRPRSQVDAAARMGIPSGGGGGGDALPPQVSVAENYYRECGNVNAVATSWLIARLTSSYFAAPFAIVVADDGALDSDEAYEPQSSEDEEEDDSDIERQVR